MPLVGTGHIWLIAILLIIALIVWGPGKLPEVGSGMGRALREFRRASADPQAASSSTPAHEATLERAPVIPMDAGAQVRDAPRTNGY